LSTRQAAERLGVSEASVRRWSDDGRLPVQRVGRRRERRFRPEDVEAASHLHAPESQRAVPPAAQVMLGGQAVDVPIHLAALYDSDAARVRLTAPFLGDGLKAGQPCFLLAQGEELDSYLGALDAMAGVDVDESLSSGLLTVVGGPGRTVADALDFWEEKLWAATDRHATVMRAVGEMGSERENFASEKEMLAYEAAFNMTARRFPCAVICQYDVRKFSGPAILQAIRAHPDMLDVSLSMLIK
jgi:excisionase family DNA binding protein